MAIEKKQCLPEWPGLMRVDISRESELDKSHRKSDADTRAHRGQDDGGSMTATCEANDR